MNRQVSITMLILTTLLAMTRLGFAKDNHIIRVETEDRPWLGVQIKDLSAKMLQNLNLENGVKVTEVREESPAEKAGIEEDDILITFNGENIEDVDELVHQVRESEIGEKVLLTFFRAGEIREAEVVLEEHSRPKIMHWHSGDWTKDSHFTQKRAWLGVKTTELNSQLRTSFKIPDKLGVMVTEVMDESPAQAAGLIAGDVIIKVADRKIASGRDLSRSINYYDPEEEVEITVIREKSEQKLSVVLGATKGFDNLYFYGFDNDFIPDIEMAIPHIEIHPDIDVGIDEEKIDELKEKLKKLEKKKIKIRSFGDEA